MILLRMRGQFKHFVSVVIEISWNFVELSINSCCYFSPESYLGAFGWLRIKLKAIVFNEDASCRLFELIDQIGRVVKSLAFVVVGNQLAFDSLPLKSVYRVRIESLAIKLDFQLGRVFALDIDRLRLADRQQQMGRLNVYLLHPNLKNCLFLWTLNHWVLSVVLDWVQVGFCFRVPSIRPSYSLPVERGQWSHYERVPCLFTDIVDNLFINPQSELVPDIYVLFQVNFHLVIIFYIAFGPCCWTNSIVLQLTCVFPQFLDRDISSFDIRGELWD